MPIKATEAGHKQCSEHKQSYNEGCLNGKHLVCRDRRGVVGTPIVGKTQGNSHCKTPNKVRKRTMLNIVIMIGPVLVEWSPLELCCIKKYTKIQSQDQLTTSHWSY